MRKIKCKKRGAERKRVEEKSKKNLSIKAEYFKKPLKKFWLLNTDITPLVCPYSPTLPERRYVYKPNNQIKGNRPVSIGYELSTIGLSCREPVYGISKPSWNPPMSMQLVPYGMNKNSFTARQVNELLNNKNLPIYGSLTVNALDSNYSSPEYISGTNGQDNLINIIRLASNRNVWKQLSREEIESNRNENKDNRGANRIYGAVFNLGKVDQGGSRESNEQFKFGIKLAKGKKALVEVDIWEDMLLRSKRGHNMKDKPFRLVRIQLLDAETGEPIFKKKMWLGVWGKRRKEITGEEVYWAYRNRYDIEHFFRFGKQKLLLDKFQTPDEEHLQNWMEIVSLSYWLLFVGREEATHTCRKWQKYDKNYKNRVAYNINPTPSQVQLQMARIILGFEQRAFLPKVKIKGKGRAQGALFEKRKQYPVLKKPKMKKKALKKTG